jgi:hypothetical protein
LTKHSAQSDPNNPASVQRLKPFPIPPQPNKHKKSKELIMKMSICAILWLTLMVGPSFGQDETSPPKIKLKPNATNQSVRPPSDASSVLTRQRPAEVISAEKRANQKTVQKLSTSQANDLTKRGNLAQQARGKGPSAPAKLSTSQANDLTKRGNLAQQARGKGPSAPAKLSTSQANDLTKRGNLAQQARGKGPSAPAKLSTAKANELAKRGKLAQTARANGVTNVSKIGKLGKGAAKLKKLSPTGLLLNDVVGTDPLSLGIDGIGDLINGTNNAEQSLKNMKKSWNKSLTKQVFTDPKGAANRVGNNIKDTAQDVGKFTKKAGQAVGNTAKKAGTEVKKAGQAVGTTAKKAGTEVKKAGQAVGNTAKKAGTEVKKAGQAVGNTAKKAGKAVGDTAKKAGAAIGGLFKKKKKK